MKRRLLKLAMFLGLGALVNIAVAWTLVCLQPADAMPRWRQTISQGYLEWCDGEMMLSETTWPGIRRTRCDWQGAKAHIFHRLIQVHPIKPPEAVVAPEAMTILPSPTESSATGFHRIMDARGWPMLSLWSFHESRQRFERPWWWNPDEDPPSVVRIDHALVLPDRPSAAGFDAASPRLLPLAPLWPGFMMNTLFYAAVIWLPFSAPLSFRRWRRGRRGLCVKCGYDLRGTTGGDRCPECGAPSGRV